MKRSPELTPLSHDHHVALEAALRLRRVDGADVAAGAAAFLAFFAGDGERHFAVEEEVLVPVLPADLARRLLDEHTDIRRRAQALGAAPEPRAARELGELMTAHVRFEEREVFPLLERELAPEALRALGLRLAV